MLLTNAESTPQHRTNKISIKSGWLAVGMIALLLLGGFAVFAAPSLALEPSNRAGSSSTGAYIIASRASNGELKINIPPGTADRMRRGEVGYILPNVIQLYVGDTIVITNNDYLPHMMLFTFVEPGETVRRTFTSVGVETYSAGCTMDPTPSGFTSLFVSE